MINMQRAAETKLKASRSSKIEIRGLTEVLTRSIAFTPNNDFDASRYRL